MLTIVYIHIVNLVINFKDKMASKPFQAYPLKIHKL